MRARSPKHVDANDVVLMGLIICFKRGLTFKLVSKNADLAKTGEQPPTKENQVNCFMSSHTRTQQNGSARANALTPINADGLSVSAYTLGIIYSLIARGNVILAHYACCHGNFSEVALQVIKNIELDTDGKLTYAAGEYMYHYICEGGIVYLCITDDDFERSKAFLFLDRIKRKFSETYSDNNVITSALPFAMNSEFSGALAKEMRYYTDTALSLLPSPNQVRLERIGVRDLELSDDEGDVERLQLLESGSSDVSFMSHDSVMGSLTRRGHCSEWLQQHWKALIMILIVGLFITVILVAAIVGVYIENKHD